MPGRSASRKRRSSAALAGALSLNASSVLRNGDCVSGDGLGGVAPDQREQSVRGGVVAARDHQGRQGVQRERRAVRPGLQDAASEALPAGSERHHLVPGVVAAVDGGAQRVQHRELEARSYGQGVIGPARGERLAVLADQQRDLAGEVVEGRHGVAQVARGASRRLEAQAGDAARGVEDDIGGDLAVLEGDRERALVSPYAGVGPELLLHALHQHRHALDGNLLEERIGEPRRFDGCVGEQALERLLRTLREAGRRRREGQQGERERADGEPGAGEPGAGTGALTSRDAGAGCERSVGAETGHGGSLHGDG